MDVRHDLVARDARVSLDGGHAGFQHAPEHRDVVSAEIAQGVQASVVEDGEPVEHPLVLRELHAGIAAVAVVTAVPETLVGGGDQPRGV